MCQYSFVLQFEFVTYLFHFFIKEFEKLAAFISKYYMVSLEKKDLSVKGWNWGIAHFTGINRKMVLLESLRYL